MTSLKSLTIEQSQVGYRYSAEPIILADFARPGPGRNVLDVGTGCCIMPILMALRESSLAITAIEIQESLYKYAAKNVQAHGLANNIKVVNADFLKPSAILKPAGFDTIVSNPPFAKIGAGRINPVREKAVARHELTLTLKSLVSASAKLLRPGGQIYLAYPPSRFDEVSDELKAHGLNPGRYFFAYGRRQSKPQFFVIEALKAAVTNCVKMRPRYI